MTLLTLTETLSTLHTVTSDGYSGTFACNWKPDIAGQYTITATFMGDDSYGSSFATTYVNVVEAPADIINTNSYTPTSMPPYEMYTIVEQA